MAEEVLHIRRSYQIEGDKRWVFWSAVRVTDEEERIVASSRPVAKPSPPVDGRLKLLEAPALPSVSQFEHEMRVVEDGRLLAEKLTADRWVAVKWNAQGQVIRMRRSGKADRDSR